MTSIWLRKNLFFFFFFFFFFFSHMPSRVQGINDGLVSVESARWGESFPPLPNADHLDQINWRGLTDRLPSIMPYIGKTHRRYKKEEEEEEKTNKNKTKKKQKQDARTFLNFFNFFSPQDHFFLLLLLQSLPPMVTMATVVLTRALLLTR